MFVNYYRLFGNNQLCQRPFKGHIARGALSQSLPVAATYTMTKEQPGEERVPLATCPD